MAVVTALRAGDVEVIAGVGSLEPSFDLNAGWVKLTSPMLLNMGVPAMYGPAGGAPHHRRTARTKSAQLVRTCVSCSAFSGEASWLQAMKSR